VRLHAPIFPLSSDLGYFELFECMLPSIATVIPKVFL